MPLFLSPDSVAACLIDGQLQSERETLTRLQAERRETFSRMVTLDTRIETARRVIARHEALLAVLTSPYGDDLK